MKRRKSLSKRISQFLLSLLVVWLLAFQVLPLITHFSSNARQLAAFIDETGIETGQFYYTGVEIVAHAESGARGSVFFTEHRK